MVCKDPYAERETMAKTRPGAAGKEESRASGTEETGTSDNGGDGIDFFSILAGAGFLAGVILIIGFLLRFVFHAG
jgi:hypothetical protein